MTTPAERRRVVLQELGPPVDVALPDATAAALAASRLVTVDRAPFAATYQVGPARHVGVAVVAGVELWVHPKVPVDRLLFLLGYVQNPKGWRQEDVDLAAERDLLTVVAQAFLRQAERALQLGVLQGYRVTDDTLPVLRGRLRVADQLGRRHGLPLPLEVRFAEWTTDIAENRLLLAAARRLLRLPRVPVAVRHGLSRLAARLDEVSPLAPGRPLPSWRATRLNARYHAAVRLAELVLRGGSFDLAAGQVRVEGFMVDMASVFEDFVTVALREALEGAHGGRAKLQDSGHLDLGSRVVMRPDLVWYDDSGVPLGVVDAKYKAEKPSGYPNPDVYQILAYCTALGLDVGHLVYAKGNEVAQKHVAKGSGAFVIQHALDLLSEPRSLLRQVSDLAEGLAARRTAALSPSGAGAVAKR